MTTCSFGQTIIFDVHKHHMRSKSIIISSQPMAIRSEVDYIQTNNGLVKETTVYYSDSTKRVYYENVATTQSAIVLEFGGGFRNRYDSHHMYRDRREEHRRRH